MMKKILLSVLTLMTYFSLNAQTSNFDGIDGLSLTTSGGTVSSGSTASPSGNSFGVTGNGFYVSNGSGTVTTGIINTTSLTSPEFTCKLASLSGTSGNGADGADNIIVSVSTDGGSSFSDEIQINGNSNARWLYSATGIAANVWDGDGTATSFTPASGGTLSDGYSTIKLTSLP